MKIDLYENELVLTPSNKGQSADLNEWFNTLGRNSKGSGNFGPGLAFDAKVYVTKRETGSGVQISITIDPAT
jgi:hypothetical protein